MTARTFHAAGALASSATSGHAGTTASRCPRSWTRRRRSSARAGAGAAGRLPVHAREGPRRRDRVGEGAPRSRPAAYEREAAAAGRDAADPGRPVRPASSAATSAPRPGPAGSTSTTCSLGPSELLEARRGARPRPSARGSAGSASTSTRTRTRSSSGCSSCGSATGATCASWATRTRRSTPSPARTSEYLTGVRGPLARGARWSRCPELPLDARRCWTLANRLIAADGRSKRLVAHARRTVRSRRSRSTRSAEEPSWPCWSAWIRALRSRRRIRRAEIAVLVRMNAQLAADRGGAHRRGHRVPGPRRAVLRPAGGPRRRDARSAGEPQIDGDGAGAADGDRAALGRTRAWLDDDAARPRASEAPASARRRSDTLARASSTTWPAADPDADVAASSPSSTRAPRTSARARPPASTCSPTTGPRASSGTRSSCRRSRRASLPIRQAKDDDDGARRGAAAALRRDHPRPRPPGAELGGAPGEPRPGVRRQPSRFLLDLRPPRGTRITNLPGPPPMTRKPPRRHLGRPAVRGVARLADRARPRPDAMPPYVIAHNNTLAAIAQDRPRTMAGLRRVKGLGPAKLEKYGDKILAVVESVLSGS